MAVLWSRYIDILGWSSQFRLLSSIFKTHREDRGLLFGFHADVYIGFIHIEVHLGIIGFAWELIKRLK